MKKTIITLMAITSLSVLADDPKMDAGKAKAEVLTDLLSSYTSKSAVSNKLQAPLNSSTSLQTLDGSKSFSAQLGCTGTQAYMKLTLVPQNGGDVRILAIEQDTSMNGQIDSYATPSWNISGVCANGFISCTPGTWDNCRNMIWTSDPATRQVGAYQGALSDLGGCYCINNSCGTGLAWSNMKNILEGLGGGIAGALAQINPYYAVAGTSQDTNSITFFGSDPTSCGNTSSMVGTASANDLTQHRANVNSLKNAGSAALNTNKMASLLQTSQANSETGTSFRNCSIRRVNPIDEVVLEDIIGYNQGTGSVTACGSDCLLLTLGRVGDNYWGGNCSIYDQSVSFYVKRPDKIRKATLNYAAFDDWIQVRANNNVIWSGPYNNWNSLTSRPPGRCELSTNWRQNPNKDFTSYLRKEGNVDFFVRTEVTGGGEGYVRAKVEVDTTCSLKEDYISDSCKPMAEDANCTLVSETVDGVEVYKDYTGTGLTPLPSTRRVSGSNCSFNVTRDWFEKKRTYVCRSNNDFDFDHIFKRKAAVAESAKEGNLINDLRRDPITGDIISATLNVTPYTAYAESGCSQVCKTRRAVPQNSIGTSGVSGGIAKNPTVYEYKYKECDLNNMCPNSEGEEIVTACTCSNEFANATAIMQTLRLAGQGLMCTSGELKGLD